MAAIQTTNNEVVENKVDIESALARMRRPLDLTNINVEVYGIYSLPDQWKTKVDDPNEQLYQYELEILGMSIKNAKTFPRELTEEEKAEQEAAKNVKGKQPPPKDPKKKEEEPSKEEVERIEREKKEKEERERKARDEWEALDEDTKFYRKNEDIFKEPCIKFHNLYAVKRVEQLQQQLSQTPEDLDIERKEIQEQIQSLQQSFYVGNVVSEKQSYELIEFEEFVSQDRGCWIRFSKLPPPEEEILDPKAAAAAKKAAPAKGGKGGAVEEMKPYFGKAWFNLEDLLQPGALETKQRVQLRTCPPLVKKAGDDGVERYVEVEEYDNVFETNQTYIYLKVTLTDPVTPTIPEEKEPLPHEIVPVKDILRWGYAKIPTDDFKKQINLAVESLAKEYYTMFKNELETEAKSGNEQQDGLLGFEERKKEFLYELNISGKYHILKEKLKKTIVRIVREHFKKTGSIKGLYKDERDHFYSELYAYLVEQMRVTVQALVQRKKNELHENITVPQEQYIAERDHLIEEECKETLEERYKRLASEYENLYCSNNEAEQYMLKYIAPYEGDTDKLYQMGKFYLRINKQEKADQYLRDAYSFSFKNKDLSQAFVYACFLVQSNRNKEAIVILNKLAEEVYEEYKVYLLLSIAYDQDSDPLMAQKYKAKSMIVRLRANEMIPQPGYQSQNEPQSQPPVKLQQGQLQQLQEQQLFQQSQSNRVESAPAYKNIRLNQQQQDQTYMLLASQCSCYDISILAQRIIGNVLLKDNNEYYELLGAILMQRKNYQDAVEAYQWILEKNPDNIDAQGYLGHCYYFLKWPQAEEAYIKTIRISNFGEWKDLTDEYVFQRLGALYIRDKRYNEAKEIFSECMLKYKNSFSHYNAAITIYYTSYQIPVQAQKLMIRANELDPYNADIWGFATVVDLQCCSPIQAFQDMKEAFKLKIQNVELLQQMTQSWKAREWYGNAKECIEHALRARASRDSMRHQKKLEEFLKAVKGLKVEEEIKVKLRDTLVKSNCLKEDDNIITEYISLSLLC